jgi:hypothetical protein
MARKDIRLPGDFAEALGDLLKVKPPPKQKNARVTKSKGRKRKRKGARVD